MLDKIMVVIKAVFNWYIHRKARKIVFDALMLIASGFLAPSGIQIVLMALSDGFDMDLVDTKLCILLGIGTFFAILAIAEYLWIGKVFEKKAEIHRTKLNKLNGYLSVRTRSAFVHDMNDIKKTGIVKDSTLIYFSNWTRLGASMKDCFDESENNDKVLKFHKDMHALIAFCSNNLYDPKNDGNNVLINLANLPKLKKMAEDLCADLDDLHDLLKKLDRKILLAF